MTRKVLVNLAIEAETVDDGAAMAPVIADAVAKWASAPDVRAGVQPHRALITYDANGVNVAIEATWSAP